jgi:pimeloyl-ACP methyl ester carboxylesterase
MSIHRHIVIGIALVLTAAAAEKCSAQPMDSFAPQPLTLKTKDGVSLAATYYPSPRGKGATTVVLLPDYLDTQKVFAPFAARLQQPNADAGDEHESFAVLTVDLRGHGGSTNQTLPDGSQREISVAKLKRQDLAAMVQFDMEAVRRFLLGQNDEGKLNLNKLTLVGAGLGASVAVNFAAMDWSFPRLATGKQGEDVKALVLISPRWRNRGITIQQALRQPSVQSRLAFLMMYGAKDSDTAADVRKITKQLEKFHPTGPSNSNQPQDFVDLGLPETSLQGTKLLGHMGRRAEDQIIRFLDDNVSAEKYEWIKGRGVTN